MILFSELNIIFRGYFDPMNFLIIINVIMFLGDLTDVSAKTTILIISPHSFMLDFIVQHTLIGVSRQIYHVSPQLWCLLI